MNESTMPCDQARDLAPAHVLGALERSEEAAVRHHLATCAEPHPEFEAYGGVVPVLLELGDFILVEPPASLGARIMTAAAADLAERTRVAPIATSPAAPAPIPFAPPAAPIPFPSAAEREIRRERSRMSRLDWGLRIAAVIAIVAVGAWGFGLQGQLDAARRFDTAVASVIQAAGQTGAKPVVLTAAEGSKGSGIGAVKSDGSVVLAMRDLPATTGSQVYEAWVVVGSDAPLAVGGFSVDPNGTAAFTTRPATAPAGVVIVLTLEPNEGNTAPQGPVVSRGIALAQPTG